MKLLCLANSWKDGGRCIAGVTEGGRWVRPVSELEHGEVRVSTCYMDNGSMVGLLDWFDVPVGGARPLPSQPENLVIKAGQWEYIGHLDGRAARTRLDSLVSTESEIFGNRSNSVPLPEDEESFEESLLLIRPNELRWEVTTNSLSGRRQVRTLFEQGDALYNLPITDLAFSEKVKHLRYGIHDPTADGLLEPAQYYFTMSLAPHEERQVCYKLVAGVIALSQR
jgi:hypothetical protein